LDANSAYWQVKIKPEDCSKTAFLKGKRHLSIFFNKGPMVIGEPQKPLHLFFIPGMYGIPNWMPIQHIGR
jgi:hypothetical protein